MSEQPLKFAARSHPERLRFRLQPPPVEPLQSNGRTLKQLVCYVA